MFIKSCRPQRNLFLRWGVSVEEMAVFSTHASPIISACEGVNANRVMLISQNPDLL